MLGPKMNTGTRTNTAIVVLFIVRSSKNSSTSRGANESAQCNFSGVQSSCLKPCDITSSAASECRFWDWRSGTGFVGRLGRPATEISSHLLSHSALRVPHPADSHRPVALSGRTPICHTSPEMLIEVAIVLWRGLSGRAREKVRGRLFFWGWAGTQSLDHCGSCSDTRGGFNRAMAPGGVRLPRYEKGCYP